MDKQLNTIKNYQNKLQVKNKSNVRQKSPQITTTQENFSTLQPKSIVRYAVSTQRQRSNQEQQLSLRRKTPFQRQQLLIDTQRVQNIDNSTTLDYNTINEPRKGYRTTKHALPLQIFTHSKNQKRLQLNSQKYSEVKFRDIANQSQLMNKSSTINHNFDESPYRRQPQIKQQLNDYSLVGNSKRISDPIINLNNSQSENDQQYFDESHSTTLKLERLIKDMLIRNESQLASISEVEDSQNNYKAPQKASSKNLSFKFQGSSPITYQKFQQNEAKIINNFLDIQLQQSDNPKMQVRQQNIMDAEAYQLYCSDQETIQSNNKVNLSAITEVRPSFLKSGQNPLVPPNIIQQKFNQNIGGKIKRFKRINNTALIGQIYGEPLKIGSATSNLIRNLSPSQQQQFNFPLSASNKNSSAIQKGKRSQLRKIVISDSFKYQDIKQFNNENAMSQVYRNRNSIQRTAAASVARVRADSLIRQRPSLNSTNIIHREGRTPSILIENKLKPKSVNQRCSSSVTRAARINNQSRRLPKRQNLQIGKSSNTNNEESNNETITSGVVEFGRYSNLKHSQLLQPPQLFNGRSESVPPIIQNVEQRTRTVPRQRPPNDYQQDIVQFQSLGENATLDLVSSQNQSIVTAHINQVDCNQSAYLNALEEQNLLQKKNNLGQKTNQRYVPPGDNQHYGTIETDGNNDDLTFTQRKQIEDAIINEELEDEYMDSNSNCELPPPPLIIDNNMEVDLKIQNPLEKAHVTQSLIPKYIGFKRFGSKANDTENASGAACSKTTMSTQKLVLSGIGHAFGGALTGAGNRYCSIKQPNRLNFTYQRGRFSSDNSFLPARSHQKQSALIEGENSQCKFEDMDEIRAGISDCGDVIQIKEEVSDDEDSKRSNAKKKSSLVGQLEEDSQNLFCKDGIVQNTIGKSLEDDDEVLGISTKSVALLQNVPTRQQTGSNKEVKRYNGSVQADDEDMPIIITKRSMVLESTDKKFQPLEDSGNSYVMHQSNTSILKPAGVHESISHSLLNSARPVIKKDKITFTIPRNDTNQNQIDFFPQPDSNRQLPMHSDDEVEIRRGLEDSSTKKSFEKLDHPELLRQSTHSLLGRVKKNGFDIQCDDHLQNIENDDDEGVQLYNSSYESYLKNADNMMVRPGKGTGYFKDRRS